MTDKRDEYPEAYRWQLLEHFRQRADRSADIIRGLIVAFSGASIYFIVDKNFDDPGYHLVSLIIFIGCIATVLWGWDVQRHKAVERFVTLRDKGYEEYLRYEENIAQSFFKKNYIIDRISYVLLLLGFVSELLLKICSSL